MASSTLPSPSRAWARPLLRPRGLSRALLQRLPARRLEFVLRGGLALGRVPVVQHLRREDGIEGEPGDEAVQDQLIWDFLEGGEDASEGADEVVEDLVVLSAGTQCIRVLG